MAPLANSWRLSSVERASMTEQVLRERGALLRVMSLADRLDVYVAREAIETGAARRILEAPPRDLTALRAALDELAQTAHEHGSSSPIAL